MPNENKDTLEIRIEKPLKYQLEDLATALSRQQDRRVTVTELIIEGINCVLAKYSTPGASATSE